MKKEIETVYPQKILRWIGAPFMAAWVFEGVVLIVGFTPHLLLINYLTEALFLFLFCLSYRNKYKCYKAEPNLKITKYFWAELAIHAFFIIAASIQSAFNVWIEMGDKGMIYRHEFVFISVLILTLHIVYMCIDYYATEKAAVIGYCKRVKGQKTHI